MRMKWWFPALAVALAVVAITAAVLLSLPRPNAYLCLGNTPAVLDAVRLAERGAFQVFLYYKGWVVCIAVHVREDVVMQSAYTVGSPGARVVVVYFTDPTCPYCALFHVDYGEALRQYVQNGTVLLAVRYFPAHTASLSGELFNASVATWLALRCVYEREGGEAFYRALDEVFKIAASHIRAGNDTYPLAQWEYAKTLCPVNATDYVQVVAAAQEEVFKTAEELGIPRDAIGTPMFIIFRRPWPPDVA